MSISRSIHIAGKGVISLFLELRLIPAYRCTTSSLSMNLSRDLLVASTYPVLLQWVLGCRYLFELRFSLTTMWELSFQCLQEPPHCSSRPGSAVAHSHSPKEVGGCFSTHALPSPRYLGVGCLVMNTVSDTGDILRLFWFVTPKNERCGGIFSCAFQKTKQKKQIYHVH